MSVSGLCQICENAEASHDCDNCGALVCDDHWDGETGFCVECAAQVQGGRDGAVDPDEDTFRF